MSARSSAGLEHLRILVDEDLDHQHEGRDQQHRRDRRQHRVQVLDGIVDAALVVAGEDAEHDRERQRGERGERADHDRGADRLDRLEQDVVAGLVRAEHVIDAATAPRPIRRRARAPMPSAGSIARERPWSAARSPAATRGRRCAPTARAARRRRATAPPAPTAPPASPVIERRSHVCRPLAVDVLEVRAAELQPRIVADRLAVDQHRFLRELVRAERNRVGLLARLARAGQQLVEQRQRAGRVRRSRIGRRARGRRQQRPEMHRIERRQQRGTAAARRRRTWRPGRAARCARSAAASACAAHARRRRRSPRAARRGRGPWRERRAWASSQPSRMRGSATVYEMSVRMRPMM